MQPSRRSQRFWKVFSVQLAFVSAIAVSSLSGCGGSDGGRAGVASQVTGGAQPAASLNQAEDVVDARGMPATTPGADFAMPAQAVAAQVPIAPESTIAQAPASDAFPPARLPKPRQTQITADPAPPAPLVVNADSLQAGAAQPSDSVDPPPVH